MVNWKVEKLSNNETIISKEPGNSMTPKIKSKQPVKIQPITWTECNIGDIVYCKVKGNIYTHIVKAKNDKRGVLIGNNHGNTNGWTKNVYGKVIEVLAMDIKPIHKFNGGIGATLCNNCSIIICEKLTDDLYCKKCQPKKKE